MEFEFDEDQRLLQQSVRETLEKVKDQPEDKLWATYTELGWAEAPPVELAIVLEELGYIADPTPLLASATWFAPLAGRLPEGSGTGVDGQLDAGDFELARERGETYPEADALRTTQFFMLGLYAVLITSHDHSRAARAEILGNFITTVLRSAEAR